MTTSPCEAPGCDRPTRDATTCRGCTAALAAALAEVPWLAAELEITLTRQARMGTGNAGRRSAQTPLPFHLAASEAATQLRAVLVGWTRLLAEERGLALPDDDLAAIAAHLAAHLESLRQHPAGGEAASEITRAVHGAWQVVDLPSERIYAGPCPHCGADCYAPPRVALATCRGCRATIDVAEAHARMAAALDDHLFTAHEMTRVLARVGITVTDTHMRKIVGRARVPLAGLDAAGRKLYRLGDARGYLCRGHVCA